MPTCSIYHFFASMIPDRSRLLDSARSLDQFPYDLSLLSCRNQGQFPDMAVRVNGDPSRFTGGELIELKDSQSYNISSFNSTIPTGKKALSDILTPAIRAQMEAVGDSMDSLPVRDVFYLIRGRSKTRFKVCLIHGSFFETISPHDLIQEAFAQVLDEKNDGTMGDDLKAKIVALLTDQASFSKVRDVEKASVKLRFRVMTEVKGEANILNSRRYPQIPDDSFNFILPIEHPGEAARAVDKLCEALGNTSLDTLRILSIRHPLNGRFLVVQCPLR